MWGLGPKKWVIKDLLCQEQLDIVMLQETKRKCDRNLVHSIWMAREKRVGGALVYRAFNSISII